MSAYDYGPSLSDQGYGPDDMPVGICFVCGYTVDEGDMHHGALCEADEGGSRLLCPRCARTPGIRRRCMECGYPIHEAETICGECACEEDSDP